MNLLHDYVAIEPEKPAEKTKGGILLAEQIKTYPPFGKVLAVATNITEIKPGDRVIYKVYASIDVDENTVVIPISGVIGTLNEES